MKKHAVHSFRLLEVVPPVGRVYRLLSREFKICDILARGDILVNDLGHQRFRDADWDRLEAGQARNQMDESISRWQPAVFARYWEYLKEESDLLV